MTNLGLKKLIHLSYPSSFFPTFHNSGFGHTSTTFQYKKFNHQQFEADVSFNFFLFI
jgi:hypothetical protein